MYKHFIGSLILMLMAVSVEAWTPIRKNMNTLYFQLAQYYAPVVYQKVGVNPMADQITRVDFDGDFVANNNWNNLDHFSTPAYVYYSVIESETHYFISYSFFHPRDYASVCFIFQCHENDLEGVILTVYKDGTPYGTVRLLETMAHDKIYTYRQPQYVKQKVAIYIEKHGHGVKAWDVKKQGPLNGENILSGRQPILMAESETNKSLDNFLIYSLGSTADVPSVDTRKGEFSYQLLNVESEFWNQQSLVGLGSLWLNAWTYQGVRNYTIKNVAGGFAGERYTTGRAHPPWSWVDNKEARLKKGDWFFDPAHYVASRIKFNEIFSEKYIYNPYLEIY